MASQPPYDDSPSNHSAPVFDPLAQHFSHKIYNSDKGRLRLDLLQQDLQAIASGQSLTPGQPLNVLDAGGGLGHMARWLTQQGHNVTLCDQSQAMIEEARKLNAEAAELKPMQVVLSDIQAFCEGSQEDYDLILCHAVLEWSQDPQQLLQSLSKRLRQEGVLSLMFYNRHSLTLRNALRGNFRKAMSGDYRRDAGSLTPENPQEPTEVYNWLQDLGYDIELIAGMRCFHDYLPKAIKDSHAYEDVLALEQAFRCQQPYLHMARYIHVLASHSKAL